MLEEERLSYLRSLQRHAAMEYGGEVHSVVARNLAWATTPLRGSQTMSLDHVTAGSARSGGGPL